MKQETGSRKQEAGLHLVVRDTAVQRQEMEGLREGSTGRVVVMQPVLARVWAVAETTSTSQVRETRVVGAKPKPEVEVAFYRKYTEGMLRRYLRLSMEAGRVPSLLGRELFRGNVTSYKVKSFEDVVIFCHDVEKCLNVLDDRERELIKRIALQEYTQGEAAGMIGISLRGCIQQYGATLDRLTKMLLRTGLMEPQKLCQ